MANTLAIALSLDVWTDITAASLTGVITNGTDHDIYYRESDVLPTADDSIAHILNPNVTLPYSLSSGQRIYARGKTMPGRAIVTQGSGLFGGGVLAGMDYTQTGFVIPFVDPLYHSLSMLDQEHAMIHQSRGFTAAARTTIANGGGVVDFLGIVPPGVFPHFRHITVALDGGPFDIDFYEAPTVSANGTPVSAYNNNRNSIVGSQLLVFSAPTILTVGTLLEPILIPGTKQSGSLGSDASNEWILKQDTLYLIRITNNTASGGTSRAAINMFWYE